KVMSYFNLFLEKTFKGKKSNDVELIENIDTQSYEKDIVRTIASEDTKKDLEIFNESRYEPESDSEVYLTSKRKENFFKVISKT
ncbi:MAG TPA: hypothetical protein PLD67_09320, partial [Sedimentibacter sp.]|nr:hypothetical protein [Sedimentibacter sp.]